MIYLILLLALGLRLINLNQSLWLDEAVQAVTAKGSFSYIFQEILGDFHPPLYHFLMHFWVRLFGSSEISLRMPSVLFGVGTVYLVYLIVNKLANRRVEGLIAALFMATAPFHIYYSQEARMYAMSTFFASFSMYYFIRVISDQWLVVSKKKSPVTNHQSPATFYVLSTTLMLYSDYYGFLVLLAQGIYLLIKKRYKFLILNTCFLILS